MQKRMDQTGNAVVIVLFVVVGLVIGFAAGRVLSGKKTTVTTNNSTSSAAPDTATKSADLRSTLVRLGVQHQELTDQAVGDALDGAPGASASGAALYANGTDIGAAVGSVYGKDAETAFNGVWKVHLDQFVNYAVAGKKGDEAGKKAALDTIAKDYTAPLSAFLAKANPNLPEDVLNSVLTEHVNMTAKMIDFHNAGKYTEEQAELKLADQHIEGIFSTLAGGIVKQFPEKF